MGLVDDLSAFVDLMEDQELAFMVVGGLALEALGVPRSTLDIDVQIRLPERPAPFSSYFHGWFIAERSSDDVFDQDVLILEGKRTGVPVEVFLTSHWFTEQALDRRQTVESRLLGRAMPVPTPEDFLLLKACYRSSPSRSEAKRTQDRLDMEGVVGAYDGELDRAYLGDNGGELGVWEEVDDVLEGA